MQKGTQDGWYTIGAWDVLCGGSRRVLPEAMAPLPQDNAASFDVRDSSENDARAEASSPERSFGWISGVCEAPSRGDRYLVEFSSKRDFRFIAYLDRFGRAFATDAPLEAPPACKPDLDFARFIDQDVKGVGHGCVQVYEEDGSIRQVASYVCRNGRYSFSESWYDFGSYNEGLSYDDAIVRTYLAFVERPREGALPAPSRGVSSVEMLLREETTIAALTSICDNVDRASSDPALTPPALIACLAQWLGEAGFSAAAARRYPADVLKTVRTVRYADLHYVSVHGDGKAFPRSVVWGIEAALNRFTLVAEELGDEAATASVDACLECDERLRESIGERLLVLDGIDDAAVGEVAGEWEARCRLGAALERWRLPYRVEASFRVDAHDARVAVEMVVPSEDLMPGALRYAMHAALVVVDGVFRAFPSITCVDVVARYVEDEKGSKADKALSGEFPSDSELRACFEVEFARTVYEQTESFLQARCEDPRPLFDLVHARFAQPVSSRFASLGAAVRRSERETLPEITDEALGDRAVEMFGCARTADVRIVFDARRRRIAERLADDIVEAHSATEALRVVRSYQEEACSNDDRCSSACRRLMTSVVEGSLDTRDQNAIVSAFLGDDRCLVALSRARALAQNDVNGAVAALVEGIAESAALDGFVDGPQTAYRAFDSYVARTLYNRALVRVRQGSSSDGKGPDSTLARVAAQDANKRIELLPDSYLLCHLEIVRLLERSFERADEALLYGRKAVAMAPATAMAYRQLGRAYMLVGDMDNASQTLIEGLYVASDPEDIAIAYYQLAYALWKMGRARTATACYLKSIMTAPVVALQATAELKELVEEYGIAPMGPVDVDEELILAGIVIAPTDEVSDLLDEGSAVAVDAGMPAVARNLLSLRLRYRPDDALANVLRSLAE